MTYSPWSSVPCLGPGASHQLSADGTMLEETDSQRSLAESPEAGEEDLLTGGLGRASV
jgi:hypothetical protein